MRVRFAKGRSNCQAGTTALSFENYGLRDPGEVSRGAVGRSISDVTSAESTLQRYSPFRRDHTLFNPFSKMKFGR